MPQLNGPGRGWRLDPITPGQLSAIRRHQLASEHELATMTKGYAAELLRAHIPFGGNNRSSEPATPAQITLIRNLAESVGDDPAAHLDGLTRGSASGTINALKPRVPDLKVPEGLYMLDKDIYKVTIGTRGQRYATRLTKLLEPEPASNGWRTHRFTHIPGAINKIRREHALTREQAMAFGQLTSSCARCGLQLKPEIKTKDGQPRWIGPKCEKEMGWA